MPKQKRYTAGQIFFGFLSIFLITALVVQIFFRIIA